MKHSLVKVIVWIFRSLTKMVRQKPCFTLISALVITKLFPMTVFKVVEVLLSTGAVLIVLIIIGMLVASLVSGPSPLFITR